MVMIPSPPICISTKITICPKTLQVVAVGSVTRPVTQVAVVAVNRASMYETLSPFLALIGSDNNALPTNMAIKKLSIMICVVDKVIFLFFINASPK